MAFLLALIFSTLANVSQTPTTASALNDMDDKTFGCHQPVHLSGQVVFARWPRILLQDPTGYTVLLDTNRTWTTGDWCEVTGITRFGWADQRIVEVSDFKFLRHSDVPRPIAVSLAEAASGSRDYQSITVTGVVTSVLKDDIDARWHWIMLKSASATLPVAIATKICRLLRPHDLLDAEIAVSGVCLPNSVGERRFLGSRIEASTLDAFTVLTPPPSDPFAGRLLTNVTPGSLHDIQGIVHRCVVSGTVTAVWGSGKHIFVRTSNDRSVQASLTEGQLTPAPGMRILLAGFIEHDPFFLHLNESVWKIDETAKPFLPKCTDVDPVILLKNARGDRQINTTYHGKPVRFNGLVSDHMDSRTCLLKTSGGLVKMELGSNISNPHMPEIGAFLSVSGILKVEFSNERHDAIFPLLDGLSIVTRTNDDLSVLSPPPWWTPTRFIIALAFLMMLLIGILAWNFSLRALVAKRSRSLLKEQAAKIEETLKIDERTRLAAELHDYLAQNLTVVSYQISAAATALREGRKDTSRFIENADKMLQACRTDLRRCLWDLKSDALGESDFSKAILKTTSLVAGDASVSARFDIRRARLSDSTAHAILSICRELVSNAVQHGQAKTIRIAGELKDGMIRFSVRDDGSGFDPSHRQGSVNGHFGLSGINERVKRLGGHFEIQSCPNKGTRALVTVHNIGTK